MYKLGAVVEKDGAWFTVWASDAELIEVFLERRNSTLALERFANGLWRGFVRGVSPGDLYKYRINGDRGSY